MTPKLQALGCCLGMVAPTLPYGIDVQMRGVDLASRPLVNDFGVLRLERGRSNKG